MNSIAAATCPGFPHFSNPDKKIGFITKQRLVATKSQKAPRKSEKIIDSLFVSLVSWWLNDCFVPCLVKTFFWVIGPKKIDFPLVKCGLH